MLPILWPGHVVEIANCSLNELRPGDIALVGGVGLTNRRGFPATLWRRAVGALFCHCSLLRRLVLKLHSRRRALKGELQTVECL
jgi:hypothetical protein